MKEYFLMLPDDRIRNPLKLDFKQKEFEGTEPFLVNVEYEDKTGIPDYFCGKKLFTYYFCISDRLKELFEIYAMELKAVPFFLTEVKKRQQHMYWKIVLPKETVLGLESSSKTDKIILKEFPKKNPYLLEDAVGKTRYLIVSLHLAENILRKNYEGIRFLALTSEERRD